MGKCLLHASCSDLCLSSQAQGAKSLGSATDANVNSEENALRILWSVVKACSRSGIQDMHRVHRWSLLYPPSVATAGGIPSCEHCSLFVHHMFPHSNCHLHVQVLSSHGGRLLLFHGWVSGESNPSACLWYSGRTYGFGVQWHLVLLLLRRRLARRQPQWCTP